MAQHLAPVAISRTEDLSFDLTPPASPSYPNSPGLGPQGSGRASSSTSTNAPRSLALKISRLLSASLEDAGTRSALETLDEFNLVDDSIKGKAVGASESRTAKSRRLRAEIDRKLLDDSARFLDAFKQVNDKLSDLQTHLGEMHGVVDSVQAQLATANSGTKHLLFSAASLRTERLATADKEAIVTVFLRRFTLSEKEIRAMNSREVPVGRDLFDAIERTETIRQDCRVLLSGEASEEAQAGMDIMLATSQHLDSAFAKLHKYTSFAARNYTTRPEELDNVSPTLQKALQLLKINRSDLFEDTLNILSHTRSSAISNMFIEALTRGTDSYGSTKNKDTSTATARPIELHAHDPIRYVGDILAWVHQAMASEREFLESLFAMKESGRRVGAARPALSVETPAKLPLLNDQPSDESRLRSLLDKNLEACGRPLRIRIQQTIKSHSMISSITTYQIFQLLQFYRVLMRKTMGNDALLCKILGELAEYANRAFFETLEDQGRSLTQTVVAPGIDLKPPPAIKDAMSTLKEIMLVHKQSLLDEEDKSDLDDFEKVLEAALSPPLELVDAMKKLKQQESERLIFECNCINFVQYTLEPYREFTANRMALLEQQLRTAVDGLTTIHYTTLLRESGLEPIVQALEAKLESEPLSHTTTASSRALSSAIRSFDAFLTHIDTLSSARLSLLSAHRLSSEIHRQALLRVVEAYGRVYDAVMDESNRYEFRTTVLHRSKEEVSTLLAS